MQALTSSELVARIKASEAGAEGILVQRFAQGIAAILRRTTTDSSLIEDLSQETFSIVIQKLRKGGLREPEKLAGFVCSVARNLSIGHFRKKHALARPFSVSGTRNVEYAVKHKLVVEVRIGAGPAPFVPARVLGYCACVADAIGIVERIVARPVHVHLFSSAPKVAGLAGTVPDPERYLTALSALAGGLRLAGFTGSLSLDIACGSRELSDHHLNLPPQGPIRSFLDKAANGNANGAHPISYAVEHSSPSMYGDILTADEADILRITVGGKAEARFWAIRQRVMMQATMRESRVAATFGLILRTLARPWYSPNSCEPDLVDLLSHGPARIAQALDLSSNPSRGGNSGLRRETRNAARLIGQAKCLAEVVSSAYNAASILKQSELRLCARLSQSIASLV